MIALLAGQAAGNLLAHPLRSLLTALSVTFGAAVLLVLVSYGTAAPEATTEVLRQMASTQILVYPRSTSGPGGGRSGREVRVRYGDLEAIREACPSVLGLAGAYRPADGPAFSETRSWPWAAVYGVGWDMKNVADLRIVRGRWFTRHEEANRERVVLLNRPLADGLFGAREPVGAWVDTNNRRYLVIGVFENQNAHAYGMYVPYSSALDIAEEDEDARYVSWLAMKPLRPELAQQAARELREALAALYQFDPDDPRALEIRENLEFNATIHNASAGLEWLVLTIAAVALVLGCLGAANVVGISVAERTAELGLRKAMGATPARVRAEVLAELLLLCAAGGVSGVLLGSLAIAALGPIRLTEYVSLAPRADLPLLAAALVVLLATAALAGLPAAARAARLDPAVALREE